MSNVESHIHMCYWYRVVLRCIGKLVCRQSHADDEFCDGAAPAPEDIQNIIRSMWSCDAPKEAPNEGDNKGSHAASQGITPSEASSIIKALTPPPAPAKPGKRGSNGVTATKVSTRHKLDT